VSPVRRPLLKGAASLAGALVTLAAVPVTASAAIGISYTISNNVEVSALCDSGSNAEVEQAVDPSNGFIYEEWMGAGCGGIAFARSTDGGKTFSNPISIPGSVGSNLNSWDPALAVGPDGTVYAAFMRAKNGQWNPVVAASFDHGQTFPQVTSLVPPVSKNWGDRDFIAVGPDGAVYVTWDFGPERTSVSFICSSTGSCAFATGDLNVVIQKSTDGGKTFGPIIPISPGFPASGGDSAPILVEPNGRIDVEYQGYQITNTTTFTMNPAHSFFTSSTDGGKTWSTPVQVGPDNLTMSLAEWWIDGALGMDTAGNLYITWDSQGSTEDVGWFSFSTDHGRHWSALERVTPDTNDLAPHITEVAGGGPGIAYVGWLTNAPGGYAQYIRPFKIGEGWLSGPIRVSSQLGDASTWPGDTFGISTLSPTQVGLSWGSAAPAIGKKSQIFYSTVMFPTL
jgi:hypothetical protein